MGRSRRRWIVGIGLGCLACALAILVSCGSAPTSSFPARLTIGLVNYDDGGAGTVEKYGRFQQYLAEQLKTNIELEPVFNELRAVEQIQRQAWSLVFAPPGLAAIAIAEAQYVPLFPLQGTPNLRSLIVVNAESDTEALSDLANTAIALGEPGSAAGYYLPLYDLYGLTLQEIRFAPTPKAILDWVADGTVAAGAISEEDLQRYRNDYPRDAFRVLHQSRVIPSGAVLLAPTVERNQQQLIETAMQSAPSNLSADAGYIPSAPPPDFGQLIQLVEKVRPLESRVKASPAVLTIEAESPTEGDG